mgnify:CR=1 FL=1
MTDKNKIKAAIVQDRNKRAAKAMNDITEIGFNFESAQEHEDYLSLYILSSIAKAKLCRDIQLDCFYAIEELQRVAEEFAPHRNPSLFEKELKKA